ncbi:Hypothetical predicted protein [Marmota monax]|uniref:Uncharacterized protein n=1 Tax=Marmota monax TaxID=9995 RepID=A0A5E4AQ04_MARMO|nr:Hypothetical predicted protein [Marmota monax]
MLSVRSAPKRCISVLKRYMGRSPMARKSGPCCDFPHIAQAECLPSQVRGGVFQGQGTLQRGRRVDVPLHEVWAAPAMSPVPFNFFNWIVASPCPRPSSCCHRHWICPSSPSVDTIPREL